MADDNQTTEFTLSSQWLAGGTYDAETRELTLHLHNGRDYTLSNVPALVVRGLIEAKSPGAYFERHLRGRY